MEFIISQETKSKHRCIWQMLTTFLHNVARSFPRLTRPSALRQSNPFLNASAMNEDE